MKRARSETRNTTALATSAGSIQGTGRRLPAERSAISRGRIAGGDCNFYYTGSYTFKSGKWRGELITHQHTDAPGVQLLFGGREVTCGFTGTYTDGNADVDGTALVGKSSVWFVASLAFKVAL